MKSQCVFITAAVCLLLDILAVLAPLTSDAICMTWNISRNHLSVECLFRDATHHLSIVDPSGMNRVQCTLGNSSHCLKSNNADLYYKRFSKPITTMMLTTTKYNSEGTWKCRHGKEERKSNVSYTEGTGSKIDVTISAEVKTVNKRNIFELTCLSCQKPYIQGVDFYIDNVLEDSIRYHDGLCYHKRNQCTSSSCTCLAEGREFTWIYISHLSHVQFKCEMRFKTGAKSPIYIHEAELIYDGTVFVKVQKTNTSVVLTESKIPNKTSNSADKEEGHNSGHIAYPVLGVVCLILIVTPIICVLRIYGFKKKKVEANDEEKQLEEVPLLKNHTTDVNIEEVQNHKPSEKTPEYFPSTEKHTTDVNIEEALNQTASENTPEYLPSTGRTYGNEHIKVVCICSNLYQEKKYTNNVIQKLYKFGFRPGNIKFVYNALPNNFFLDTLKGASKLIIVLPKETVSNNECFIRLVEIAVRVFKGNLSADIFPIVRSKNTTRPMCLSNIRYFSNTESALKDALQQCPFEKKMNELTSSINQRQLNFKQNRLNNLVMSPNVHENVELYQIVKGWGVEVEENRVSFHMKTLQSQSRYEPTCLHDVLSCLLKGKSLRFLKMYDVERFDLTDLKLHTHMFSQLTKMFGTIIDMKEETGKWWYHYRRNGLTYISPSEAAFKPMKRVFLNKNVSAKFEMFVTNISRIDTLQNFPIENTLCRKKIAEAGFFYFNVSDYVQCFYCGGCLRSWMSTDDPVAIHSAIFKSCAFVMQLKDANRMIMSGVDTKLVMDSNMYSPEYRFNSFQLFPKKLSHDELQRLSNAGFYYCGIATDIICCACNIGFAHVPNVGNIMKLHEIYSPDCPNATFGTEDFNQEYISNFVQYLELELREHDLDTLDH